MSLKQLCVLSVLACTLSSAGVTSAAELSVNGHIRTGGACGIALGNAGVIDLGNLSREDIPADPNTPITRDMPLTINCQHPAKVGLKVTDNRAGTKPPGSNIADFGLGNPAIGDYKIFSSYGEADGRRTNTIHNWGGDWGGGEEGMYALAPRFIYSWNVQGGQKKEPVAFKTLTSTLGVEFSIKRDTAFTDELEIDGSATLELVYL